MMPLNSRRMLFVRRRSVPGLAPLQLALIVLATVSLLALMVAIWPNGRVQPSAHTEAQGRIAPAGGLAEGVLRVPAESRKPGSRTRSI